MDPSLATYLRTASMREELRSKEVTRILQAVVAALEAGRVESLALRGTSLPYIVYPHPSLRHSHDLDLLVRPGAPKQVAGLLADIGFEADPERETGSRAAYRGVHRSGLPVEVHESAFSVPRYRRGSSGVWDRSVPFQVGAARASAPSPADQLFHVCVHASTSWHRHKLVWVTDAWLTIERHPGLQWELLVERAKLAGACQPLSATLGYLADELDASLPATVIAALQAHARKEGRLEREIALFGAWAGPGAKLGRALRDAGSHSERAFLLRWRILPSPAGLVASGRARSRVGWLHWWLGRPFRFAMSRLRRAPSGPSNGGSSATANA
jgi:hypothetical protein